MITLPELHPSTCALLWLKRCRTAVVLSEIYSLLYIHSCVYYFFAEHELSEQRQLVEAVRGILTPAVCSALSPEQQAFLNAEASWQPPAPATGMYLNLWCCCIVW